MFPPVLFATTVFGDSLALDVSVKSSDYPVYWYDHEESLLQAYAPNFAECIKSLPHATKKKHSKAD